MARFGRGQPHPPIFLRAPLVAIVAAATVSPIHVIDAPPRRPPQTHVYYVRPSRASLVPDRLPVQIHVVQAKSRRGVTHVLVVRNPQAPAVAVTPSARQPIVIDGAPRRQRLGTPYLYLRALTVPLDVIRVTQIHVVSQVPERRQPFRGDVLALRNPLAPPAVTPTPAPWKHVVSTMPRRPFRGEVLFLRTPLAPAVVSTPAPWKHVISLADPRALNRRLSHVIAIRSRAVLVPDRLPPRIHVVSRIGSRLRELRREAMLVIGRARLAPSVAISLPLQVEDRSGFLYGLLDQSTKRYLVMMQSSERIVVEEDSQPSRLTDEQSGPKLDESDQST